MCTLVLSLYVIKSNDPSGGMKDIVRSLSNRAKRTHLTEIQTYECSSFKKLKTFYLKQII